MPDVVGAAAYEIQPDLGGFAAAVEAAIGPALQAAVATAAAAGAEIGASIASGVAPAMDEAAAAVASGADEMASSLTGAIEPAVAEAADAVASGAGDMASSLSDSVAAGAESAAGSVAAGASDMASSIRGSLGPAAAETVAAARDEFGRFKTDAAEAGATAKESLATSVTSVGDIIKGVAAGNILAEGISTGVESAIGYIQGLIDFMPALGAEIHKSFSNIRIGTGETGAVLDGLKADFKAVASNSGAALGDISLAITDVNKRLDLSGQPLQDLSLGFLRLSSLTGSDLQSNIKAVSGVFNNFNVSAEDQGNKLEVLFRIYQQTGTDVASLTSSMSTLGPITRQMGLSFEDTAAMIGTLNKAGIEGSAVQMGLTKIMKSAAEQGKDAGGEMTRVFGDIKNGIMTQAEAIDLFGPKGVRLFDLIKQGALDYQGLAASVTAGGDTLKNAAVDTGTWTGQLSILSNQIKMVLEPIATTVFTAMTAAMRGIRPLIIGVYEAVVNFLMPVWQNLVLIGIPVWQMFDKVRAAFADALKSFKDGLPLLDAIQVFFDKLTGNEAVGDTIANVLRTIATAASDLWEKIQPVRDVIGSLWESFKQLLSDNPEALLAGLAATVTALVIPAIAGLGAALGIVTGFVSALLAPIAAAVTGALGVALAIGAITTAVILAYNNWEGFRNIVDTVAAGLIAFVQSLPAAFETARAIVTTVLDRIRETWDKLWPVLVQAGETVARVWSTTILPALQGLWESVLQLRDSLQPVFDWMIDHWQIIAGAVLAVVAPFAAVAAGAIYLYTQFEPVRRVVNALFEALGPLVSALLDIAGNVLGNVINAVSGLLDILSGLLTWDWDKVREGIVKIASAILDVLGNIGSHLLDALKSLGPLLLEGLGLAWEWVEENAPGMILGLLHWLAVDLPLAVLGALAGLGGVILNAFGAAFGWLVENGPSILGQLGSFLLDMLTWIPRQLLNLGAHLLGAFVVGFRWVVEHGPEIIASVQAWLSELPGRILGWLGDLGALLVGWLRGAWDFVTTNGAAILAAVGQWFSELPGVLWGKVGDLGAFLVTQLMAAFDFVRNQLPGLAAGAVNWFMELPGRILSAVGNLGSFLWENVFVAGFNFIAGRLPGMIDSVVGFFRELPGKIISAIGSLGGAASDFGKNLLNGFIDWFNSSVIGQLNQFSIDLPIAGRVDFPDLPFLAKVAHTGGIVGQTNLPNFAGMLRPDEVPIVAQLGEGILPRDVMKILGDERFEALRNGVIPTAPVGSIPGPQVAPVVLQAEPQIIDQSITVEQIVGLSFDEAMAQIQARQDAAVSSRRGR